jgi:peptide/nickel transport system permease protein
MLFLTMLLVSVAVFVIAEASPGNVARNVLGAFITPEQEASFLAQLGMDKPVWQRYVYWLVGSDWHAERKSGLEAEAHQPPSRVSRNGGRYEEDGSLVRWELKGDDLMLRRMTDGTAK